MNKDGVSVYEHDYSLDELRAMRDCIANYGESDFTLAMREFFRGKEPSAGDVFFWLEFALKIKADAGWIEKHWEKATSQNRTHFIVHSAETKGNDDTEPR